MCWSVIGFSLLDSFVLYDLIYKKISLLKWIPIIPPEMIPFSGFLLGLPLAFLFYNTHVKGK